MTKKLLFVVVSLFVSFFTVQNTVNAQEKSKTINLFESRKISDWDSHFVEPGTKVEEIYSFNDDGILECKGKPFGYIATPSVYKNFKMSVDYRWKPGEEPTNSGVFLRVNAQPKESFLPRGVEAQLAHGSAGDLWAFHGEKIVGPTKERNVDNPDGGAHGHIRGSKRIEAAEKAPGEWNTMEILCNDGLIVVVLNGKIVNWTTEAETTPGKVGLQSEGGPVQFRNCFLTPLE
ncbi:MAG: 3-keto-disaccharide hydrolase [Thermoguttaceae bacterium]